MALFDSFRVSRTWTPAAAGVTTRSAGRSSKEPKITQCSPSGTWLGPQKTEREGAGDSAGIARGFDAVGKNAMAVRMNANPPAAPSRVPLSILPFFVLISQFLFVASKFGFRRSIRTIPHLAQCPFEAAGGMPPGVPGRPFLRVRILTHPVPFDVHAHSASGSSCAPPPSRRVPWKSPTLKPDFPCFPPRRTFYNSPEKADGVAPVDERGEPGSPKTFPQASPAREPQAEEGEVADVKRHRDRQDGGAPQNPHDAPDSQEQCQANPGRSSNRDPGWKTAQLCRPASSITHDRGEKFTEVLPLGPPHKSLRPIDKPPTSEPQALEKLVLLARIERFLEPAQSLEGLPAHTEIAEDELTFVREPLPASCTV